MTRVRLSAPSVLYIVSSWGPAREATHSVRSSPFSSIQSEFSHVLSQNTTAFFLHPSPPYSAILWSNFHTAYRDAARHIRLVTSNKREHNDFDLKCYRQDVWNLFLAALCGRDKNKVITGGLNSPIPHVRPSVRPPHKQRSHRCYFMFTSWVQMLVCSLAKARASVAFVTALH